MSSTTEHFQIPLFEQMLFPTDLESVLMDTHFPTDMLMRASIFRQQVVRNSLTRFNARVAQWRRPVNVERVILVVGQVETDPTLRMGEQSIRTNLGLLKAVCHAHSDAHILYKPHPEVWANLQAHGVGEKDLAPWCDECVADVPLGQLLPKVNEVHVMSSLAGFEALLRGKKVSCYAQAFYAGWGLTTDMVPMPQRQRQLSVDELVAGALFSYPRYMRRHQRQVHTPNPPMQVLPPVTNWRSPSAGLSAAA